MNFPDYYAVLGLPRFYPTQEEIRDAFLQKLVELNASGDVDPNARQTLDSAYLTLSDTKKKREYDEVLDRYVEAEKSSEYPTSSNQTVIIHYDWHSSDKSRRCWSIDPESDRVYDFLFQKAETLNQIIHRYPFESEIKTDFATAIEWSMSILYNCFLDAYSKDYAEDEMKRIIEDGLFLLSLYPPDENADFCYPANYDEKKNQRLLHKFDVAASELFKAVQLAEYEQDDLFNFFAAVYISHMFDMNVVFQKIRNPDFQDAYQSMKRELRDLLERFFNEKEFVT